MKKSEFTKVVISSNKKIFSLVGPNSSGKSYYLLNNLYNELPDGILLLDENGRFQTKGIRKRIKISNKNYIYDDELNRGLNRDYTLEAINIKSLNIINGVKKILMNIDTVNKSLGTNKLNNILSSILYYNLNHIEFFLFDEPENSLDDEGMKCIQKLFNLLIENDKKVFFITHSPRLLELLQIEIDDIYIFPKIYADPINISKKDVYEIYNQNGYELQKIKPQQTMPNHEKYDFLPNTKISEMFLEDLLKSSSFYRVLFYSHVVIVEGATEELIARYLSNQVSISRCIFKANGKYKIPFIFKFFKLFCEKITCIIDSDFPTKEAITTFSSLLTHEIESYRSNKKYFVYSLPKDLETYLGFNKKTVISQLSGIDENEISGKFVSNFSSYYKSYIPLFILHTNHEAKDKLKSLLNSSDDVYNF